MLAGCGGGNKPSPTTAAVIDAVGIGKVMYVHDVWAARASDAVLSRIAPGGEGPAGWVTEDDAGAGTVTFPSSDGQRALFRVTFPADGTPMVVEALGPDTPLTARQRAMYAARQAATASGFKPCSDRYNTIVLPASLLKKEGWLVYLVPAGTDPHLVRVGGYYRVHVSSDGTRVLSVTPFSESCLVLNPKEAREQGLAPEGIMLTHVVSDTPMEHHVFLNLLHQTDIFVGCRSGIWRIHKGNAIWVDDIE